MALKLNELIKTIYIDPLQLKIWECPVITTSITVAENFENGKIITMSNTHTIKKTYCSMNFRSSKDNESSRAVSISLRAWW